MTRPPALQRWRRRRVRAASAALGGMLLLTLSACGSSPSPKTEVTTSATARARSAWYVLSRRSTRGAAVAGVGGTANAPAGLEIKVQASPAVSSQLNYSLDCERSGTHPLLVTLRKRQTPFKLVIPLPPYTPECFINVTVSKSAPTDMTLTLLAERSTSS